MILLINTFVTNERFAPLDRGLLPLDSRADVFKYMLSSIEGIEFSSIFINFELSEDLSFRKAEICQYIFEIHPSAKVLTRRLKTLSEWRAFLSEEKILEREELIFYSGNDDHIFIDRDFSVFNRLVHLSNTLKNISKFVSMRISHFPEVISTSQAALLMDEFCSVFIGEISIDSIGVFSPEILREWFFVLSRDLDPSIIVRRTEDFPHLEQGWNLKGINIVPKRELFRHFDGYTHVGISVSDFPPLSIPKGYFQNNLRLYFGELDDHQIELKKKEGWTYLCAKSKHYESVNTFGATLKTTKKNIPAHWKDKITEQVGGDENLLSDSRAEDINKFSDLVNSINFPREFLANTFAASFNNPNNLPRPFLRSCIDIKPRIWTTKHFIGTVKDIAIIVIFSDRGRHFLISLYRQILEAQRKFPSDKIKLILLALGHDEESNHNWRHGMNTVPGNFAPNDLDIIDGIYTSHVKESEMSLATLSLVAMTNLLEKIDCNKYIVIEQRIWSEEIDLNNSLLEAMELITKKNNDDFPVLYSTSSLEPQGANSGPALTVFSRKHWDFIFDNVLLCDAGASFSKVLIDQIKKALPVHNILQMKATIKFVRGEMWRPILHIWNFKG